MKSLLAILGMTLLYPIFVVILLIVFRCFVEARYIPSTSMQPTINLEDRLLVEKVKTWLKRPYKRGEIVVFYPPPIEMGGADLNGDVLHVLGRLTGLPFLPNEPAFIKRVIGIPGDTIRIVAGEGVFVNDKRLEEDYIKEPVNYSLKSLEDIHGRNVDGDSIEPYGKSDTESKPIVVPPDQLFLLGDDRNNSEDSHVFGMVGNDRVIGRVMVKFYPELQTF